MGKEDEDKAIDDKIKARAAELEKENPPEPKDEPEDEPEEVDEPEARAEGDEPAQRPKDNRWRRMNEERDQAKAEAAELRAQMTQLLGVLHERRGTPEPKEPAADPLAEKLDRIKRERTLLLREVQAGAGKLTPEQLDAIEKRAERLEEEHVETLAERLVNKRGLSPQRQEHPLKPFLALQFPDVVQNAKAVQYAKAHFDQQLALGRPETMELVIESHQRAREALRTAPAAVKPDPRGAARRVGMGAGPGPGAANGGDAPVLSKDQRKMADALYGDIADPKKRYAKWANGPGKRAAAKRI